MREVYLDTAATAVYTSVDEVIINEIARSMREYWMNPSSLYATDVRDKIDECRANIAKFIGAKTDEIYFTSGASESNNWALRGFCDEVFDKTDDWAYIITTKIEHKSILNYVEDINSRAEAAYCKVDKFGLVDLSDLERLLNEHDSLPTLVSVAIANNEIGTIQDIKRISDLVHEYGGFLHVDATQILGKTQINVETLGIDMLSASGHKISPVLKGIGFLYKNNDVNIKPLIYGAQEKNLRGGTENTFGIIGLSKAIEYCDVSVETVEETIKLRDYFINQLETKFGCKLNGHPDYRLSNNISVTFPQNITGEALLYTLDLDGMKISTGSACNSKEIKQSHVLQMIGLTKEESIKTIRISIPNDITYDVIDKVVLEIGKSIKLIEN